MIRLDSRHVERTLAEAAIAGLGPGDGRVTVFDSDREDDLVPVLGAETSLAIDVRCRAAAAGLAVGPGSLTLRLTTAAAARLDVASAFATALSVREPGFRAGAVDLRIALQEAIGNAVLHGNLGLDGGQRRTREGLVAFGTAMAARLADPAYAALAVTVAAEWDSRHLVVAVEDCGVGFDPAQVVSEAGTPMGMGLAVIRSRCGGVSFSKGGRRIAMAYAVE